MNHPALQLPLRELLDHWQSLADQWRDIRSQEFYETFLDGLADSFQAAGAHIAKIESLLKQVRTDCE